MGSTELLRIDYHII
jgi:26S proteasome regulatory subunit T4